MQNSKYRKNNMSSSMIFFSLLLAIIILSFVLVSSSIVGNHDCIGDHCVICLFTSRITVSLGALVLISFVISLTISLFVVKPSKTKNDTLITLKEKLTS